MSIQPLAALQNSETEHISEARQIKHFQISIYWGFLKEKKEKKSVQYRVYKGWMLNIFLDGEISY